jgi:hypothetical protein
MWKYYWLKKQSFQTSFINFVSRLFWIVTTAYSDGKLYCITWQKWIRKNMFFVLVLVKFDCLMHVFYHRTIFNCQLLNFPSFQMFKRRGLKLKLVGGPHSREKMLRGPQLIKKGFAGLKIQEKPSKIAKFDQTLYSCHFLKCSRAAPMHQAGRVFETPVQTKWLKFGHACVWLHFKISL